MTDRYQEWRAFYAEKVSSWMRLEELRAECGKLQTTDATSPEVLLIHAMHALEEFEVLREALRGWWMSRRPVGWTEDQHRSCPHVNLVTNAEKALADAMLKVKAWEASND